MPNENTLSVREQQLVNDINQFLIGIGVITSPVDPVEAIMALNTAVRPVQRALSQKPAVFISGATVIVGEKICSYIQLAQEYKNENGYFKVNDVLTTSNVVAYSNWHVETKNTVYVLSPANGTDVGAIEVIFAQGNESP